MHLPHRPCLREACHVIANPVREGDGHSAVRFPMHGSARVDAEFRESLGTVLCTLGGAASNALGDRSSERPAAGGSSTPLTHVTSSSTAAPTAARGLPRLRRLNPRVSWRSWRTRSKASSTPTVDEWYSTPARICTWRRAVVLGCSITSRRFSLRSHDLTIAKTIRGRDESASIVRTHFSRDDG